MKNLTVVYQRTSRACLIWLRLAGLCGWLACSQLMAADTCPQKAPAWGNKDQLRVYDIELLQLDWDRNCRLYLASRERKLMRFDASGQFDEEFGKQGFIALAAGTSQMIVDNAHQRLLLLNYSHGYAALNIEIHALNMDGQAKLDFGRAGVVKMLAKREHDAGVSTSGRARMLVQADGSLLVAAQVESAQREKSLVWLFKVSKAGMVVSGDATSLLAVQTSNNRKIHLSADGNSGAWFFSPDDPGAILARITANGQLDAKFATGGILKLKEITEAVALLPEPDGVILAGTRHRAHATLTRYRNNGVIDQRFGDAGKINLQVSAQRKDLLLTVAAGGSDFISAQAMPDSKGLNLQSWRRDGTLDINWGKDGDLPLAGAILLNVSLLRDPLGRLFLAQSGSRSAKDKNSNADTYLTRITRIQEPASLKAVARKPNSSASSVAAPQ